MKRRSFLIGCAASLAGLVSPGLLSPWVCTARSAGMRDTSGMNVLLIGFENLRADAIGCYGNPVVQTPNLDRFATRATRFTRCYCQSPRGRRSRDSILTGLRPDAATALTDSGSADRTTEVRSLPEILHQYGLRIADVGRSVCSLKGARKCGESRYTSGRCASSNPEDSPCLRDQEVQGQAARIAACLFPETAERQTPFFTSMNFRGPHMLRPCPEAYLDLYNPDRIPAPQAPACRDRDIPSVAKQFEEDHALPVSDAAAREAILAYYGRVSFIDAQIGTILDTLERTQLSDDTIVIVFSHHGFHLGEHGLWGPATLFEQSTRVPLLIRVPGVTTREVICDEIVELVDLLPTVCDLLAVPTPDCLEGKSFAPLLRDPFQPWKRAAFTVFVTTHQIGRSVRTKRWRYTDWQSRTTSMRLFELYDLDTDPWEQNNLALNPDHRNERTILANLLQRGWQAVQ